MMIDRFLSKRLAVLILLMSSVLMSAGYAQGRTVMSTASWAIAQDGVEKHKRPAAELFARTELYFGSDKPDGEVTKEEFRRFLKEEITPRFPDGLTVLTGTGQFRDAESDKIIRERAEVLILFYPLSTWKESNEKIEQIRKLYKDRFQQQSVLRVDDSRPILVSF